MESWVNNLSKQEKLFTTSNHPPANDYLIWINQNKKDKKNNNNDNHDKKKSSK